MLPQGLKPDAVHMKHDPTHKRRSWVEGRDGWVWHSTSIWWIWTKLSHLTQALNPRSMPACIKNAASFTSSSITLEKVRKNWEDKIVGRGRGRDREWRGGRRVLMAKYGTQSFKPAAVANSDHNMCHRWPTRGREPLSLQFECLKWSKKGLKSRRHITT